MASARRGPRSSGLLRASDIEQNSHTWPRPLYCQFCSARVHAVNTRRTERHSARAPHFARDPHTATRRNDHGDDCIFNVAKLITVLIGESGGALHRAGRVADEETMGRQALYRLPWPRTFGPAGRSNRAAGDALSSDVFGVQATQLLNTASKITALIERYVEIGADPGVTFQAVCHDVRVEWLNFFYVPGRSWVLAERLRRSSRLAHPVALIFRPVARDAGSRYGWVRAEARTPVGNDPAIEMIFAQGPPRLINATFGAVDRLAPDRLYLGYGMWELATRRPDKPARLTLDMSDDSAIAPVPPEIDPRTLRRWSICRPLAP